MPKINSILLNPFTKFEAFSHPINPETEEPNLEARPVQPPNATRLTKISK